MTNQNEPDPDIGYEFLAGAQELDSIQAELEAHDHSALAADLFKLQQDIGLQYVGDSASASDGELTEALIEKHEGNTQSRMVGILRETYQKLENQELKSWMAGFLDRLKITLTPAPARTPRKGGSFTP
jgi:hypothetical protein